MGSAKAPQGTETQIRAIVFREGDTYVAQCLKYQTLRRKLARLRSFWIVLI